MAKKPKIGQLTTTRPRFEDIEDDQIEFEGTRFYELPQAAAPETTVEPRGAMRAIGDTAVQFGKGAVTGVRMMSDVFGADNAVSGGLRSADEALNGLLSATAKQDQAQVAAIMQEAEGKGWMEQIGMGLRAAGVAPGALLAQAAGTAVPTLAAAAMTGGVGPMATAARFAAPAVMGGIQGMGATKGAIYETTKQELMKAGASPEEAEARAVEQQSYGGDSSGQIALGTGLGVVAGGLGIERAMAGLRGGVAKAAPGMMTRMGTGAVTETVPEFAQGGQEKYATNSALNNEGFQVDPMSGVVANATMEGIAGAGMGAAFGIPRPDVAQQQPAPAAPPPGPMQRAAAAGMPSNFTATPAATLGAQTPVNAGAGFNAGNLPNGMGAPAQIMDQAELDALVESERRDQQVMLAQMDMERQKQAEIDAAFEAKPALEAQQRAATLDAPSAMQQAFQQASQADQVAAVPSPVTQAPEPRIVERTPDMKPMPLELAELQVEMDGGEVVRTQNRNGKYAYHVIKEQAKPKAAPVVEEKPDQANVIKNNLGKPFTNLFAANNAASKAGAGWSVVKVGKNAFEVHRNEQNTAQGTDTTPAQAPGEAPQAVAGDAAASSELPATGESGLQTNGVEPPQALVDKASVATENVASEPLTQPAQPVTGEGAGVSQPTQDAPTNQGATNGNESTQASQAAETLLTPKAEKPKKLTPNQRIAKNLKGRADYFATGNIVQGYSGHDRVISYKPPTGDGEGWNVTVQSVVKQDGKWVTDPKDNRTRTHSTMPGNADLARGPVERASPTEQPTAPSAPVAPEAPISISYTENGKTLKIKDAKASLDAMDAKINKFKEIIKCLRG